MEQFIGRSSIMPEKPVYILAAAGVVGTKEGQGPLGALFDETAKDDLLGCKTWEEAESMFQRKALLHALKKAGISPESIRYLFAGDLQGQSVASSFGMENFGIPYFGLYGACSTCGEALILATMTVAGGCGEPVACVTSSHFASAEKEFRYPLDYGNQRPLSASWTVTGSGAFVVGTDGEEKLARISAVTVGHIVDYGLKDSMNMGACMAPAAAATILQHMEDFNRRPGDYDKIITGDLGSVGREALLELLRGKGFEMEDRHTDCGILIYDSSVQDVHAGGSGCGCCASVLAAYILKQLKEKAWHRVLFLPTGALLSKTSFNEGRTVPGICHALVLEAV